MSNPQKIGEAARKAYTAGKYVAAAEGYEKLAVHLADPAKAYLRAALCAALSGNLGETIRLFEIYFWSKDSPSVADLNDLLNFYHQTGQRERVAEAVERRYPSPIGDQHEAKLNRQAMVFALPKSAGTSVVQTLAETLGVRHVASGSDDLRAPGYSASVLEPELLRRLSGRQILHQTHAMPWQENMEQLRRHGYPKFIVHLRDPRDALLSYYYMAENYELHRLRLLMQCPDYDRFDLSARMRFLIRTVYPVFLEWIIGWVAAADALSDRATVTSFERFKEEPESFFKHLTFFLSGKNSPLAPIKKIHFRKGKSGQTDDPLLPPSIREELYQHIPTELSRRFGWKV